MNKYKIVCKHPVDGRVLHVAGDMHLSTKAAAKDVVSVLKLVNPRLKYEISKIKNDKPEVK
jgi:hypothetical protein